MYMNTCSVQLTRGIFILPSVISIKYFARNIKTNNTSQLGRGLKVKNWQQTVTLTNTCLHCKSKSYLFLTCPGLGAEEGGGGGGFFLGGRGGPKPGGPGWAPLAAAWLDCCTVRAGSIVYPHTIVK